MSKKKKIIYIMGAARSGSTLLDIVLGNQEGIKSIGELNRYPKRGGVPPQKEDKPSQLSFWNKIKSSFDSEQISNQKSIFEAIEYHTGLFKRLIISRKPPIDYINFNKKLVATIFENIEEKIIIDCSKYPGRALSYKQMMGEDYELLFVYLKRHPISVIRSFQKTGIEQPPKHWFKAMIYYKVVNYLDKVVARRIKKKHRLVEVFYEELTNQPTKVIEEIQASFGLDLSDLKTKIKSEEPLIVGNLFDGNRIRLSETIHIRKSKLPQAENFKEKLVWWFNKASYRSNRK